MEGTMATDLGIKEEILGLETGADSPNNQV